MADISERITPYRIDTLRAEVNEAARDVIDATRPGQPGGWSVAFRDQQFDLVMRSAPRLPGAEMHDSMCDYASAYCRLVRAASTLFSQDETDSILRALWERSIGDQWL